MPPHTTTQHNPAPPTTTHHDPPQSTTTHHQPKYIHQHSLPPTTRQNKSITTYYHSPPPTTSQVNPSTLTTTHHKPNYIHHPLPSTTQKMDHHPAKAKIYSNITSFFDTVLTVSFSPKYDIPLGHGDFE